MSRTRSCVGILFIISMTIGIVLGYWVLIVIKDGDDSNLDITIDPIILPSTDPEGFQSVLIVGVDSLMSQTPSLEGAWVVTLKQTNGHSNGTLYLDISTLYPVTKNSVLSTRHGQYAVPHRNINIDPDNLMALTKLEPISFFQGEWNDIIVLDEVVINMLVSLQNPNISRPIPTPHPSLFIKPWEDPEGAFKQQRAILTTLCDHPEPFSEPELILEIIAMNGQHLTSSMGKDGLLQLWQVINYTRDKGVSCSFFPE